MVLHRVRYNGLSDERIMSKKDLASAGVVVDQNLHWDARNKSLVLEDPSERLLELFKLEGTFTVSELDAGSLKEGQVIIKGSALDDTGNVVKDATNGQVSERGVGEKEEDPAKIKAAAQAGKSR